MPYGKNCYPVKLTVTLWLLMLCATAYAAEPSYHLLKRLHLGGEGGWDYPTIDGPARRLYLSRGHHLQVVDLTTDKVLGDIPDTPGIHGIALAPELHKGFTSNGKANTVSIFDLRTLKVTGQVKSGDNPDAIVYDPATKKVIVCNGRSHDATVIDAISGAVVKTIPLGGKPEFAVADGTGRIFVNIMDSGEVATIDCRTLAVVKRFPLAPCQEPTGIALDQKRHRIFSGCRNRLLSVLDSDSGKLLTTIPIGGGVDGVGYDPVRKLAFSANGDGTLTVVREAPSGKFTVETLVTLPGARTMAIDPVTHLLYLPTALFEALPEAGKSGEKLRPVMIRDSFEVLVVGQ
jgi:DNA-binding beta-propeller fold protein YncE